MEAIYKLNRLITMLLIMLKSNIGLMALAMLMVIVDAMGSAYAISEIFKARFTQVYAESANTMALLSGVLFSVAMLVAILVTALKESLRKKSGYLAVASGFLSFVGFMFFIVPENSPDLMAAFKTGNAIFFIKVIIAMILAFFPSYVISGISNDIANNHNQNQAIRQFSDSLEAAISADILRHIAREDGGSVSFRKTAGRKRSPSADTPSDDFSFTYDRAS